MGRAMGVGCAGGQVLSGGSSGRHHQHLRVRRLFNGLFDEWVEGLRERERESTQIKMMGWNLIRIVSFIIVKGMLDLQRRQEKEEKKP
jgi:hypothetical protein